MHVAARYRFLFCILALTVVWGEIGRTQGTDDNLYQQIDRALAAEKKDEAVELLGKAIAKEPSNVSLLQIRGETLFRMGKVNESVPDFDKVVELRPESKAANWQRGIALYYVGRFKDGAEQFEEHHRVNPDDVENTFWYFLCLAKADSMDAARKKIIPSRGDSRAPLMDVYRLVRAEATPQDVEKAIEGFDAGTAQRKQAEFYGYLYLGLWFDLQGDTAKAIDYLEKSLAANDRGYMADVGKVHLQSLKEAKPK
jgi:tetratricopeptide (TPR) repeat protein